MKTTSNTLDLVGALCSARKCCALVAYTRPWWPWPWQGYEQYQKALPHLTLEQASNLVHARWVATLGTREEVLALFEASGRKGPPVHLVVMGESAQILCSRGDS
jgi:hypothetical protein